MGNFSESPDRSRDRTRDTGVAHAAVEFAQQAEKLSLQNHQNNDSEVAVEARFVTPQDPIVVTSEGNRLPGVPLVEAHKLNVLKEELQDGPAVVKIKQGSDTEEEVDNGGRVPDMQEKVISLPTDTNGKAMQKAEEGSLRRQTPPSHTNPLFPPLPLYGPPSLLRDLHCLVFRISAFFLSLAFLGVIVLGALFTSIPPLCTQIFYRLTLRNPDKKRPFFEEEARRNKVRKEESRKWRRRESLGKDRELADEFVPTEGGPDPIVCDVGYYARRVGLDVEEFQVQTEDGFLIDLWHVYDPKEYTRMSEDDRSDRGPDIFTPSKKKLKDPGQKRKFPVLLIHGLLQSSGAYCTNDEDSLAFYLCKSGYDVWLGNNRCGFKPKHASLEYSDPRMWCWNIRQMGVFDLPALTSRVLYETGFEKIGLICHSQGTTQTLVALAKEQRPDLGEKLTVFCALAPAAYAGPLIGKMYFKFMRIITPGMFRLMFGIHAFIPFMMQMHELLHPKVYGWLGYKVFSFLFDWTDTRWDRGLRDRMFQFAPVYVSAESMRWWLGRECFARHKCILSTKEDVRAEEKEDHINGHDSHTLRADDADGQMSQRTLDEHIRKPKGSTAWYNEQVPPFALWVAGNDDLVDGKKLLRRFERGREPHVNVVHSKVIPEYEHLDVIWAMDAPEQVFKEVREVLWKTCDARDECRVPKGCDDVEQWSPPNKTASRELEESQSSSDDTE
ncbi:sterol esterase 2 [Colletotrichum tofieldiae]|uniref:Sterol esterase 2 n=1 Tax=Colletotrichum tofieldiae TaxID=708197 RepID=A0A166WY64_9PEZI|nr:sterol esterase 2 [Colletotrichum tofieldiae]GKT55370.1 sterol esterase 2 [Colletotrichum tofieldiae]GKT75341.1 sterol esterase 2 [Colletotrichum tofieldiae]